MLLATGNLLPVLEDEQARNKWGKDNQDVPTLTRKTAIKNGACRCELCLQCFDAAGWATQDGHPTCVYCHNSVLGSP